MSTEKRIGNYLIEVIQENDPQSPREWDNLGKMICFHSRYNLGDKHDFSMDEGQEFLKSKEICVSLPLYLYDHSGITMSTSPFGCRFDSRCVGFIYVTKEQVRKEYGVKRINKKLIEKVTNILENEVKIYDQYLTGDVYGYRISKITECELGHEHKEEVDSCWGFYGEDECMTEAEGIVDYHIKNEVVTDKDFSDMLHSVDNN